MTKNSATYRDRVDTLRDFFSRWYATEGRSFPWRHKGTDPYGILVAEILLKQTRAESAAQIWPELIHRYATVGRLAMANPSELFQIIARLGFGNQRTIALIEVAAAVRRLGEIPSSPEELMKLPHVGLYTSHAVACFGFDREVPTVDVNALRVISRVFSLDPPLDIRRAPVIWEIAWEILPHRMVKEHNYGLLDFAAAICKSRLPKCLDCPIATVCAYGQHTVQDASIATQVTV